MRTLRHGLPGKISIGQKSNWSSSLMTSPLEPLSTMMLPSGPIPAHSPWKPFPMDCPAMSTRSPSLKSSSTFSSCPGSKPSMSFSCRHRQMDNLSITSDLRAVHIHLGSTELPISSTGRLSRLSAPSVLTMLNLLQLRTHKTRVHQHNCAVGGWPGRDVLIEMETLRVMACL